MTAIACATPFVATTAITLTASVPELQITPPWEVASCCQVQGYVSLEGELLFSFSVV
jgi:hypothetical protein